MQILETALVNYKTLSVYDEDITALCTEYIDSLPNAEMVYKSTVFTGLLDYIYKHCLKRVIDASRKDINGRINYNVLDSIFYNIYIPLCYKYSICPTVLAFSVLCNISRENITDVKNGFYRNGCIASSDHTQIVKKWSDVCENATVNKAINESSIGAIFGAKALYGLNDSQTIRIESANSESHDTAEQIASRHNSAMIPEKPQFD